MASRKTEIQELKEIMLDMQKSITNLEQGRREDRKYLDKKLEEQTAEINDALDQQDIDNRKELNKFRQAVKEDQEKLYFEYKSDFYTKIDPVLKEITASREERTTTSEQISRNREDIDKNSANIASLQTSV